LAVTAKVTTLPERRARCAPKIVIIIDDARRCCIDDGIDDDTARRAIRKAVLMVGGI